tara:strand:- start:26 stop:406 length:381 start_codon:yes stop_codon:yes gene_type:complete
MKLNQLKRIIENEIKTLKEQGPDGGIPFGPGPVSPLSAAGGRFEKPQLTSPVRPQTGGVTPTGLSDAQYAQLAQELRKVGFTIEGTGPNAKCSILMDLLVRLIMRMILNQIINDIMDEINLEENHN